MCESERGEGKKMGTRACRALIYCGQIWVGGFVQHATFSGQADAPGAAANTARPASHSGEAAFAAVVVARVCGLATTPGAFHLAATCRNARDGERGGERRGLFAAGDVAGWMIAAAAARVRVVAARQRGRGIRLPACISSSADCQGDSSSGSDRATPWGKGRGPRRDGAG